MKRRRAHAALPLLERAYKIDQKVFAQDDLEMANVLHNLGTLYFYKSDYNSSVEVLERALKLREKKLGPNHPQTVLTLQNLANVYQSKGDAAAAGPLYQRVAAVREKTVTPDDPAIAESTADLAKYYVSRGDFAYCALACSAQLGRLAESSWRRTCRHRRAIAQLATVYLAQGD